MGFSPACKLGKQWFADHHQRREATIEIAGRPAALEQAIERAAELCHRADYPLIYGLSRSATPGQRAAVALGDSLGAVVDTTASLCHGPSIMALQEVGEVTSTLGEIRNRADLVIFWGCHPAESHPRHAERYSVTAAGRFVPAGRADRKVVMIGSGDPVGRRQIDDMGSQPDLTIRVEPGKDFELLMQLTRLAKDTTAKTPADASDDWPDDVPAEVQQLMSMIRECKYGVFFFGLGLAGESSWGESEETNVGHVNVAALLHLVAELNAITRFTARRMRLQGDVSGADNVLCWQTGYPFAVDFSRGYPRYNPGEYSANDLLARGDVDLCVLIGAETLPFFSPAAIDHLRSIPVILLDYPGTTSLVPAEVRITTAVYGLHAAGTVYRMDNVPIPLRAMAPSELPTDEQVLTEIQSRLV